MTFERVYRLASIPALVFGFVLWLATSLHAQSIGLLRDADIEHGLAQLAKPVLGAAGLNPKRVRVVVVNLPTLNAFVIDSRTIFIHYGLILKVKSPEMLQAVIAHEAAHITNGHLARRLENLKSARSAAGLGTALGLLAAVAGAGGDAAAGIALGTRSAAERSFLSHTRAEESAADRTAASIMKQAGVPVQGMLDVHQLFAGQEVLSAANQDPYTRSHPLSRDRIRATKAFVAAYGDTGKPDPAAAYWLDRVQGKLSAFLRAPKWTMRRASSDPYADVKLMREAIAYHRNNKLQKALASIDGALRLRPKDGFYLELRGQFLMENRRWGDAMATYQRAAQFSPNNPLILASLGRAQLAANQPRAALKTLEKARSIDFRNNSLLRDMAQAYAKTGQNGMASLVTAERYALRGRLGDAGIHAKRASGLLPTGSAAWRRAQDVLIAAERFEKRKKR
ncbi:M48 family metalloprotease [Tritonibacter litoralis]|nr:M48 family metalloprotease [Tritonibacter litoralis]